jgi:hypothetical protein
MKPPVKTKKARASDGSGVGEHGPSFWGNPQLLIAQSQPTTEALLIFLKHNHPTTFKW